MFQSTRSKLSKLKSFALSEIVVPANRYKDEKTDELFTSRVSGYDEKKIAWLNSTKDNGFDIPLDRFEKLVEEAHGRQ